MIIILVAEIAVGITAYAMKDTARVETKKFLSSTIKDYYATGDRTDAVTLMWNSIMMEVSGKGFLTTRVDFLTLISTSFL